jgi:hypothetical protein
MEAGEKVTWPGHGTDFLSHVELKSRMSGAITSIPAYIFFEWCLMKRRDILITESARKNFLL